MIRAVIGDTWRQSKQQVVFIVMLVVMLLVLVVGIVLPRPIVSPDGQKQFGTMLSENPDQYFAREWVNEYALTLGASSQATLMRDLRNRTSDENLSPAERGAQFQQAMQEQQRLRTEAVNKASDVPEYRRAVEYYIRVVVGGMFKVTMLLFIAACAGYFPAMLGSGAIDIVLAKPVSRWQIFSSRYVGGITLYAAAMGGFMALLFVGIGLRTGVWHYRMFASLPLLVFSAMVLYGLLALVGTNSRSATMAMVAGYVFYVVVDSLVELLLNLQPQFEQMGWESVSTFCSILRVVLPNFGLLNDMALAALLNMPVLQAGPFAVALAWLAGSLALGFWIFNRRDY